MSSNQAGSAEAALGRVELYDMGIQLPGRSTAFSKCIYSNGWRPVPPSPGSSVNGSVSSRGLPSVSSSSDQILEHPSMLRSEDEASTAQGSGGGAASCGIRSPRRGGKSQSEVYRKLVSRLEEHVKADPFRFDFARCRLPPFVSGSQERRAELQKQLETFAAGLCAEGLPHGWQPPAGAPSVRSPSTMSSNGVRNPSLSSSSCAASAPVRRGPLKMSL